MPRKKEFKTKTDILEEIRRFETKIEKAKKESKDKDWEATDQGSLKLGASCMVTSDSTEYAVEQKAMAQQQCNEYEDMEERAVHRKETVDKQQEKWEKRLVELRELKDNWTGAN
ncbi:hypothetical protein FAGAP_517 [Fusarium agapanthi]|uniref:Uncharacterized protein n=1 Tax=Fusarium agapanthi TaxID=1803897 RepID=A0A9P5BQV0_9HYPO|nr:hypothetical protein FAGAP_517 [Fusarium agapanthi]